MSWPVKKFEYQFEIETMLHQFLAMIDGAMVMTYNKNEKGERELQEQIKPSYVFGTKQRIIYDLNNKAKNFTLPIIGISITSIKADKERLAAKYNEITSRENDTFYSYDRPTPITISLSVNIVTKYITDLYQIFAKLCSQFQPYRTYSWYVPQSDGSKVVELRNKITWDFNLATDFKESIKEDEEDRFTGKMNFEMEGWIFNNAKTCMSNIILDIGTSEIYSKDLADRVNEDIPSDRYLAQEFYKELPDENYKNPREFANAHPRLVYTYLTMYNKATKQPIYFLLDKGRIEKDESIFKQQAITIDGYNMKNADVLLVPKKKVKVADLEKVTYDYSNSKLFKNRLNENRPAIVTGYKLPVKDRTDTTITVDLDVKFTGECDIIVCDIVDYDSITDLYQIKTIKL